MTSEISPRAPEVGRVNAEAAEHAILAPLLGQSQLNPKVRALHLAEFSEPSIWLWRRIVGCAFAFIAVTMAWFLVKLPDGLISDRALPTQTQVAAAFNEVRSEGFGNSGLFSHAGLSLFRLVAGMILGLSAGAVLGVLSSVSPTARTVTDPISSFLRMVPALAFAPLVLIWFGTGEFAIVTVAAMAVMWPMVDITANALVRQQRGLPNDITLELTLGLRSALLLGWGSVLAVETLIASSGLGAMIWQAQARSDVIAVGMYLVGLIGFMADTTLRIAHYLIGRFGSASVDLPSPGASPRPVTRSGSGLG